MALFRKKQKEDVPAELEAFYEQEPTWKRWLRRLLAILIIIALVAAIIWAATRVYEQVTNRDVDLPGPESSETAQNPSDTPATDEDANTATDEGAGTATEGQGQNGANQEQEQGMASNGAGSESTQQGSTANENEGTVDSGAVSTTEDGRAMPSTGPADALWIVLGVAAVSTIAYQLKLRRQ